MERYSYLETFVANRSACCDRAQCFGFTEYVFVPSRYQVYFVLIEGARGHFTMKIL